MSERVIAVTGAASGMGAATRQRLEAGGARVVGVDLYDVEIVADLGTPPGRARAIERVLQATGGRLDGLVLAAGIAPPTDDPALVVSVNYFGVEALLCGLQPALAAAGRSRVVVVGSNSMLTVPGIPQDLVEACLDGSEDIARKLAVEYGEFAAYGASKTAAARIVRRRATTPAYAGAGIRLNALAPGLIDTPMFQRTMADPLGRTLVDAMPIPVGSIGTADQVAVWIEFLLGDAAEYLCGQVIVLDGGSDALVRADHWPANLMLEGFSITDLFPPR